MSENDSQDMANYIDTEVVSDYVFDQSNVNLTLVPVEETILFSGVPEPIVKPIPQRPEYSKSVIISIKNKKMLLKNLENYLNDKQSKLVYKSLENSLNFNLEENLTFLMNEEDYVLEIQTFSKNFKNLNSRRDSNEKFVFYYEATPTERKVTRNRLVVKDSVSRTLKSAEIPPEIAKEFIQQLSYTIDFQRDVKSGDIIDILYEADFTKNNTLL